MLPADYKGRPRCPTCFRRLRKSLSMDVFMCPARTCPLEHPLLGGRTRGYVVTGLDLARAR